MKSTAKHVKNNILNTQEIFTPMNTFFFTGIGVKCQKIECSDRMQEVMTSIRWEQKGLSKDLVEMQRQQIEKTRELNTIKKDCKGTNNSIAE